VLVVAVVADDPVDAIATYVVGLAGASVFTACVLRRRPYPLAGWLLMVASVWMVVTAVALAATSALRHNITLNGILPTILAAAAYPVMAMGLVVLSRSAPRARPVDVVDAAMTALAAFLLLWAFAIEERIDAQALTVLGTAAFALGILLVFSLAVRLALVGGMREPVLRLLILGVFAILAAAVSVLLPILSTAFPRGGDIGRVFWALFVIAVGAAGIHPALAHVRLRPNPLPEASARRIGLFAVLALVPPAVWSVELARSKTEPTEGSLFIVPVCASAVFLLLLVTRVGIIARIAHQRATQLSVAVSEQQELQRQLAHLAMHDSLTGLANRRALSEQLKLSINHRRGPRPSALLLMDLDGFKDINDTFGHPVGDELLIAVSRRLLDAAPPGAILARLGGDEFAMLLDDAVSDDPARYGEELVEAFRRSFAISGREMFLTGSIGVLPTEAFRAAASSAEILRDADLALYAAKAAGKNQVVVFRPELRTAYAADTYRNTAFPSGWPLPNKRKSL
jgi:diguanylate cyclase (GGDEF)-like protein